MAKNQNYYISVTAECKLSDGEHITVSGLVKLMPGCDKAWLDNTLTEHITNACGRKPNEVIVTSLSQISRGLYNRLRNLED